MNEKFDSTFKEDRKVASIVGLFSGLAIFIACLGLYGLVTFTTEQRSKEIGIRKVLGASLRGIVLLLSRDFGKLMAYSIVLAIPVAWYFMDQWLREFAYRIDLDVWIFILAAIITTFIGWLAMSFQSIRAGMANPVDSIRSE